MHILSTSFDSIENHGNLHRLTENFNQQRDIISNFDPSLIPDTILIPYLLDYSSFLLNTNQIDQSIKYSREVITRILEVDPNLKRIQYGEIYSLALQKLARTASARSKFMESIQHLQYSINMEKERVNGTNSSPMIGSMLNKIGRNHLNLRDTVSAYQFLREGNIPMKEAIPTLSEEKRRRYFSQFTNHLAFEVEAALALDKIDEAQYLLGLIDLVTFSDFKPIIDVVLLRAKLANQRNDYQKSVEMFLLAREIAYQSPLNFDEQILYHLKRAEFEVSTDQADFALKHLDTANNLANVIMNKTKKWTRNMVGARTERIHLLNQLNDEDALFRELSNFLKEINEKLSGAFLLEDHVSFIIDFYPIFEIGLNYLIENQTSQNLDMAFTIMECTSALSLFKESLLAQNIQSNPPDSIISIYKESSAILSHLVVKAVQGDSSLALQNQIYLIQSKVNEVKESLLDSKKIENTLSLAKYSNFLDKDSRHILTFAGKNYTYFLTIERKATYLKRVSTSKLNDIVGKLQAGLPQLDNKSYQKHAESLGTLLKPILNPNKPGNVYFTGDGDLSTIPIEALILDGKFLNSFPINLSYSPSARMLYQLADEKIADKLKMSIFRPSFEDKLTLDYAIREASALTKILEATVYEGQYAVKDSFVKNCELYDIIHLTTHAKSFSDNSAKSRIDFSDQPLYFDEIKSLTLNSDMIYLGACETSIGANYNGEGVMSLARNFIAGGARSVISSMWKIPDQSTASISIAFYENLKKGETKSAALKKAKLDWIKAHPHEGSHPYYWAGLVLTGNDAALFPSTPWHIYLGGAAMLLLTGLFLFYKFRNP